MFRLWLESKDWKDIEEAYEEDTKVDKFNSEVQFQIEKCLPNKTIKVCTDDAPWCNDKVKKLKGQKGCEYSKHRRSPKWINMNNKDIDIVNEEKKKCSKWR